MTVRAWLSGGRGTIGVMTDPSPIILDCDPGHDDAVAMLLAWGNPAVDLLAVTTVAGNQTLDKVTRNALGVARAGGMEGLTVAAGADRPLVGPQLIPEEIHGESGLDGPALPAPDREVDPRHAVDLMADILREREPGTVTLVPTGALTNIALLTRMHPDVVDRVRQVVLMGGGHHTGNMTPAAEFNILADPEAAALVFDAPWTVTMCGLDVTHKALATPHFVRELTEIGTPLAGFVAELLEFFGASYTRERGYPAPPMHDPVAVAAVIDPTLVRTVAAPVAVETRGEHTRGMTVVDLRRTFDPEDPSSLLVRDTPGAVGAAGAGGTVEGDDGDLPAAPPVRHRVAVDLDVPRFHRLILDAIRTIGTTDLG